jgi:hypothetical protein
MTSMMIEKEKTARIFTLYLSTQTPAGSLYAPVGDITNKSIITWNINWNALYGGTAFQGEERFARVKFQLLSLAQDSIYTFVGNSGVLAIQGLGNQYSNSANGLTLGAIYPVDNPVAGHPSHILQGDTLQTGGVLMNLPYGYQPITVLMLNREGALMSNVLDYQLIVQFEME